MSYTTLIASRFLKITRKSPFSWITILSIIGISIGVASMITVVSVINGFETELRNRFLAANAHILVYNFPEGIKNADNLEEIVEQKFTKDITGVSPFIYGETMGRKDYLSHAMIIKGIDPAKRHGVQNIEKFVTKGSLEIIQKEIDTFKKTGKFPEAPGVILGKGLASMMEAKLGDTIQLVAPGEEESEKDDHNELKPFKIVGIYDSGLQHYDNKLGILSTVSARNLFNMGTLTTGLEIGLKDPDQSIEFSKRMMGQFKFLTVKEWKSYNRNIFEAMKSERAVISLIVALVAFVASFNILTTLFISVTQKQKDISILKAIGSTTSQILTIFIKQSAFIGILGSVFGMILGVLLSLFIERLKFGLPEIYSLESLPIIYDPKIYLIVAACNIVIATMAGLYPAWAASRIPPLQGITHRRRG